MERNNDPPRVIVVGAGLAGPLIGLAIRRLGWDVVVCDDRPRGAGAIEGAWLTVAVNGLDALRTLGVDAPVRAVGFPSRDLEIVSGDGTLLGRVPLGGELADGTVTHTLQRAALHPVLVREAEAAGVRFHHDRRFVSLEDDGSSVLARFEDGTSERGAILVGADGIGSRVRAAIDPDRAPRLRFTGLGNVGGFTPRDRVAGEDIPPGTYRMAFGARAFFGWVRAPEGDVWWFANPPAVEGDGNPRTDAEIRARLLELFAGDRGPMAPLIRGADGALVWTLQHDLPRVPTWTKGRVVLVGDAAHAASPASGQGVSMAAEDAIELARALRDRGPTPAALAAYEAARRPRAEAVVAYGARYASQKAPGPVQAWFRDRLLPHVFRWQARHGAAQLRWLFDHHIDWTAPSGAEGVTP